MRILWMKPIVPYPPVQGTSRVTLQILANLAAEHRIRLFARRLGRGEEARVAGLREAVPGLEVTAPLAPNRASAVHRALYRWRTRRDARRGVPPVVGYTAPAPLLDAFAREAAAFAPELVVAEYWYAAGYLKRVPGVPAVLFAHDLEYRVRERAGERDRDGARPARWAALETACEKEALAASPFTWFLTDADRAGAVADGLARPGRSAVVPYGVDLDRELAPRGPDDPPEDPDRALLFGSFRADFNRDALAYTLEAVWPALRRLHPRVRLTVAGGGLPPPLARRAREAGAEVRGEVRDVRRLLLEAAVVLVPLRYGGGLRIRLLESLALERAVVGTPVGVLGMGPEAGREVLVGESAEALAGAAARALRDPALRAGLGRAGREWVGAHHGLGVAARIQRELLRRSYEIQTGSTGAANRSGGA